jgi:hypothetical protein
MEFLLLLWWELVQNAPLIFGFVGGFYLLEQSLLAAVLVMVANSAVAALAIAATEAKIFQGHRETLRAVVANVVIFSAGMLVIAAYLFASWSSWQTDVIGGVIAGIALAIVQDWAARERFGVVRGISLGLSCSVSIIIIRLVGGLWAAVVAVMWFTLVMGAYKQWWQKPRRVNVTQALHNGIRHSNCT